jgi:hypothetical protein
MPCSLGSLPGVPVASGREYPLARLSDYARPRPWRVVSKQAPDQGYRHLLASHAVTTLRTVRPLEGVGVIGAHVAVDMGSMAAENTPPAASERSTASLTSSSTRSALMAIAAADPAPADVMT